MSLPVVIVCRGAIFEIARRTTGASSTTDKTDWSVGHRVSCSPIVVDSTRNSHIYVCMYIRTGYVARPRSCLLEMQYASASARAGRARTEKYSGDLEMLSRARSTRNRKRRHTDYRVLFFSTSHFYFRKTAL